MNIRYTFALLFLTLILAASCSTLQSISGMDAMGPSDTMKPIQHPPTPEGVTCYVCHKTDRPTQKFHSGYGNNCEKCHVQTTWMANKYAHPGWNLDANHRTRCTRCHTNAATYDFATYQCYGCHHNEAERKTAHAARTITDLSNCIRCHQAKKTE